MPTFTDHVDIDVDVFEFLSECDGHDIDKVIRYLVKHKHIPQVELDTDKSAPEQLFEQALTKIHGKWNVLTAEEEQVIYNIAKRF
jgi:hypothetical protein